MRKYLLFSILILGALFFQVVKSVHAQSPYRFQNYGSSEGIPLVLNIKQDSLGYIWLHSPCKLTRFDGYSFTTFKYDPEDSTRFPATCINLIETDARGNLWVASNGLTGSQVLKFDFKQERFIKHKIITKSGITDFSFEKNGVPNIWLITSNELIRYNELTGDTNYYTTSKVGAFINAIDLDSVLLLGTDQGLWLFEKSTNEFRRPSINPSDTTLLYKSKVLKSSQHNNFISLRIDDVGYVLIDENFSILNQFNLTEIQYATEFAIHDSLFYFGTRSNGLAVFDSNKNMWTYLKENPSDKESLQGNRVSALSVDRDKNLWVGTYEKGVSRLLPPNFTSTSVKFETRAIRNYAVHPANGVDYLLIAKTNFDSRGFKTNSEVELVPWTTVSQPGTYKKIPLPILDSLPHFGPTFQNLYKGKNHYWLAIYLYGIVGVPFDSKTGEINNGGVVKRIPEKLLKKSQSWFYRHALWEDKQENLWTCSRNGLIKISPLSNDSTEIIKCNSQPLAVYENDSTSLWVITKTGVDYIKINERGNTKNAIQIFKSASVSSIFKAKDGTLYISTMNGLYKNSKLVDEWHFSPVSLLKGHSIFNIREDGGGRLWLLAEDKIICYSIEENTIVEFKQDYIVPSNDYFFEAPNGKFILGSQLGMSIFNPEQLIFSNLKTSPVLTRLEVNNKVPEIAKTEYDKFTVDAHVSMLKQLVLDYQHNDFSLEFSSMQMTDPKKNRYRYKLEGYDNDWIETDWTSRRAHYTNLHAGTYTFIVKATNHHGAWSENEKRLTITILPPPWKTTWAYASYFLLVTGILYLGMRSAAKRERMKSGLRLKALELKKAKEVDQVKSELFANISHEFRTPLTLIKGPVQTLLEQATDKANKDQLLTIQRNANHLLKLVNQLLELARLESGTVIERKEEEDLSAFLTIVAGSFNSMAEQKHINYTIELPKVDVRALFDKDKLETILINLINNAIKFTPANGSIKVNAALTQQTPKDALLTITITDTGVGIPTEKQRKVFERFYQVSEAHKETGTGIGLSLVKELVQILNGKIELQSTPGAGSIFTVVLPLTIAGAAARPSSVHTEQAHQENTSSAMFADEEVTEVAVKPMVLVVEDHTDLRQFIISSLGNEYRFIEAENGKDGLEKARQELPDLIISDVMMPDMDGITMTGKIRKDLRTSHIPIILLTAKATEEAKLSGLSTGADDYLTKPFDKNELVLKVRNSAARQKALREQARMALLNQAPIIEVASADEVFLQKVKTTILNNLANERLSVEGIAHELGLSRSQLFRKVTALTGSSMNELIRSFRLQRAAQLLEQKWGPVSQVAYEVGFSNLSYFTKCFKEQYGVLPSEYRKN